MVISRWSNCAIWRRDADDRCSGSRDMTSSASSIRNDATATPPTSGYTYNANRSASSLAVFFART
jgi:hypothetical protein